MFKSVDSYTTMSLCDLIYQICTRFKDHAMEFAMQVFPLLLESFQHINEVHVNSIFSMIGNRPTLDSTIDSLQATMAVLGPRVESHAQVLISRAIAIAMPILQQRAPAQKVMASDFEEEADFFSRLNDLIKVEESDVEVARKVIELMHNVFRNLISGVSSDIKTSYKSLLGVPQMRYSEQLQRRIFEQTPIIDFFLTCFKVSLLVSCRNLTRANVPFVWY